MLHALLPFALGATAAQRCALRALAKAVPRVARAELVDALGELLRGVVGTLALGEDALGPELRPLLRDEQQKLVDWYVAKRVAQREEAACAS